MVKKESSHLFQWPVCKRVTIMYKLRKINPAHMAKKGCNKLSCKLATCVGLLSLLFLHNKILLFETKNKNKTSRK